MSKELKVNLSLLNDLVVELERQLNVAYSLRDAIKDSTSDENYRKFVIETSKSVGILSGIAQEAGLLIGDLQKLVQYALQPKDVKDTDSILNMLLPALKGKGEN